MKPNGKREEECANHEEVSGLDPRVLSLNSGKLTHRLRNMAIALVDEPSNSDQDDEDYWNGDAAQGLAFKQVVLGSTIFRHSPPARASDTGAARPNVGNA